MVHQVWLRQSDTASVRNCMKLLPSWNTLYLGESIIRTYVVYLNVLIMLTEREKKSAKVKFINWKKKTELEVSGKELKEHKN